MSFDPDSLIALGRYEATLTDETGKVLAEFAWDNLITTVGKNLLLDQGLAASAYTAADFMGLISSASFSAVAAADTMTSHAGWLEAGTTNAPTMSSTRQTLAWSAASGGVKGTSAPASFVFTGTGTVQGAFIAAGSGATSAVLNTGGVLFSAGTLTTAQPVISGNTLTVSYTATLT